MKRDQSGIDQACPHIDEVIVLVENRNENLIDLLLQAKDALDNEDYVELQDKLHEIEFEIIEKDDVEDDLEKVRSIAEELRSFGNEMYYQLEDAHDQLEQAGVTPY